MSTIQWVSDYLCVAALVVGCAMMFAAWSRKGELTDPGVTAVPALLAGALWPLVAAGLAQWMLVHALGKALRHEAARKGEPVRLDAIA